MASTLRRLPCSSICIGVGDRLISRQYQAGRQHEKATTQPDGRGGKQCILEEKSSEPYKPLPTIKTNLKLTANILQKNALDGFSSRNIVCSPLSLNFVMNMVAVGSKGDTLQQLLSFIGSSSLEDVNMMSSRIIDVASKTRRGGPNISFVNGVWVNQRFPLKLSYKDVLRNTYKAEVKNIDMAQVVEEVNSWVDKKTKGLINDILSHGSSDDTTVVILGNALYFKGVWSKEFDTKRTENRDFHLLSGKTVSAPFMTSCKQYFYGASDGFKVLKIPYQRGSNTRQFSMFFLLPHEIDGLQNLLEKLKSNPDLLHQDFGPREVKLHNFWIPKFKFSYMFEAQREMQQLGLTLPFDINCEDITEMVHTTAGVYVSNVIHKAVIEVDEKGTEAAAVTIVRCFGAACARRRYVERYEFVADHPFLFMIKEEMTGAILFVGTVFNPLKD